MQEGVPPLVFSGSLCRAGHEHHLMGLWHVNCAACCPGQFIQLCSSAQIHSHVLAKVVAISEQVTSTLSIDTVLFNSVLVPAAWGPFEPANTIVEGEDPELVPQMQFMVQVAQLLVVLVRAFTAQSASTVTDHSSSSLAYASNTLEKPSQDSDIRAQGSTHANA